MDQRRRGAVLAAAGAVIASSSIILTSPSHGGSGDFLRGFALGLAGVLIIAAVVLVLRGRRGKSGG
jgi:hypothetical protein